MKKRIFNLLFLSAVAVMASAQTITVADVDVMQGKTASFDLYIDVDGKDWTGLEFDMKFPNEEFAENEGFVTTKNSEVKASWNKGQINPGLLNNEGKGTVTCFTMDNTAFIPNGIFGSIEFSVGSTVPLGEYEVTLTRVTFMTSTDRKEIADVTFKVNVVDVLTLDENSTTAPAPTDGAVKLLVKRTINADTWSTICLPFEMTADQWKEAFGSDAKIHRLSSYEKDGDAIKVSFQAALTTGKFVANRPYVIKTSKDITSFEVTSQIKSASGKDSKVNEDDDEIAYMQGTFKAGTVIPEDNVFVSGGKFYYSDGTFKSKAFRAYFWFADKAATSRIIMSFDDETTGIKDLNVSDNDKVFDLQGRIVNTPGKGVYVKGGKKVLVK